MNTRPRSGPIVSLALLVLAGAGDPPAAKTPGLAATQVTVEIFKKGEGKPPQGKAFRATVVAKAEHTLTIITAAHCVSQDPPGGQVISGGQVFVIAGGEAFEGELLSVVRNPRYNPAPGHDLPGPDSAVVQIRVRVENAAAREVFEAIKPAVRLTGRTYPWRSAVVARVIDRRGVEHAIRGGNFSSPLFLEWAAGYKPIPGDSGSGVFVVDLDKDGRPSPSLIGVVVGLRTDGGGPGSIATLVSLREPWVTQALKPVPPR